MQNNKVSITNLFALLSRMTHRCSQNNGFWILVLVSSFSAVKGGGEMDALYALIQSLLFNTIYGAIIIAGAVFLISSAFFLKSLWFGRPIPALLAEST